MQVQFQGIAVCHESDDPKNVREGRGHPAFLHGEKNNLTDHGYSIIGTATLTVELHDPKTIHALKVSALQDQLKAVRIENHQKENAILEQISKLQAIDYDPSAPTADSFPDIPF